MTCDEVAHNSSLEDASCTYGLVESSHGMEGACYSYAWVVCRPSLEETYGTYGLVEDIACLEGSCETCILEHVMYVQEAGNSSQEESYEIHDLVVYKTSLEVPYETYAQEEDTVFLGD